MDLVTVDDARDLTQISTEDLRRELSAALTITADAVARMARIWRELERRGEDLSALRSGIGMYLSAVAAGRLLAEAVVRLAGNRYALKAIASLTLDEQRRLLEVGTIQVVRSDGEVVDVPIHRLSSLDAARAIDVVAGRVKSPAEQRVPRLRARARRTTQRIVLLLSAAEHETIMDKARRLNIPASQLILDALRQEGVL
jgi:hypothetical protein